MDEQQGIEVSTEHHILVLGLLNILLLPWK